jgi:hypothetical protein
LIITARIFFPIRKKTPAIQWDSSFALNSLVSNNYGGCKS